MGTAKKNIYKLKKTHKLCILNYYHLIIYAPLIIILKMQILKDFFKRLAISTETDEFGGTKRDWKSCESRREDVATQPQSGK